jgi:hypothetical protein
MPINIVRRFWSTIATGLRAGLPFPDATATLRMNLGIVGLDKPDCRDSGVIISGLAAHGGISGRPSRRSTLNILRHLRLSAGIDLAKGATSNLPTGSFSFGFGAGSDCAITPDAGPAGAQLAEQTSAESPPTRKAAFSTLSPWGAYISARPQIRGLVSVDQGSCRPSEFCIHACTAFGTLITVCRISESGDHRSRKSER